MSCIWIWNFCFSSLNYQIIVLTSLDLSVLLIFSYRHQVTIRKLCQLLFIYQYCLVSPTDVMLRLLSINWLSVSAIESWITVSVNNSYCSSIILCKSTDYRQSILGVGFSICVQLLNQIYEKYFLTISF